MSAHEKTSRFFGILVAIAVVDLWVLPMRSSFWLDETATFWIVKDGVANLLHRSLDWAGQSPLYYLTAWLALVTGGRHEWVLRLPSLIALMVAAWLLYRLAQHLFDPASARLAVLSFACSGAVAFAASDARPYALGLCLLIGSAWLLVRWLETGSARYAAGAMVLSVLTIYDHYLFGPVLVVLAFYTVWRAVHEGKVRIWGLLAVGIGAGVLLLPLVAQLRHFYQDRAVHSFSGAPLLSDLFTSIAPPVLAGSLTVGLLLAQLFRPEQDREPAPRRDTVFLAAGWALAPPLLLFAISVLSPSRLFVPRYYISCIPGQCCSPAGWPVRWRPDRASALWRRFWWSHLFFVSGLRTTVTRTGPAPCGGSAPNPAATCPYWWPAASSKQPIPKRSRIPGFATCSSPRSRCILWAGS